MSSQPFTTCVGGTPSYVSLVISLDPRRYGGIKLRPRAHRRPRQQEPPRQAPVARGEGWGRPSRGPPHAQRGIGGNRDGSPPARDQAPSSSDDGLKYTIVGAAPAPIRPRRSQSMQKLYTWLAREDGQTMAEYGVVLAVITIAVFGALALLAGNIVGALTRVAGYIT